MVTQHTNWELVQENMVVDYLNKHVWF